MIVFTTKQKSVPFLKRFYYLVYWQVLALYRLLWLPSENLFYFHIKLMGKMEEYEKQWAEDMQYLGPRAVRNYKKILYQGFYTPPEQMIEWGKAMEKGIMESEDTKEGFQAFAERRKPNFKDK